MRKETRAFLPKRVRFLVIHHDAEMRRKLASGLVEFGCEAFEAEGREDGLPLMYQVRPDLIFLELVADREDSRETFSRVRLFTDTPTVLLTDQPLGPVFRSLCKDNAVILVGPLSVEKAIAKAKALCKPFAMATAQLPLPGSATGTTAPPRRLNQSQLRAIDHAMAEVGDSGEVRLEIHRGRLRFLAILKSESIELDAEGS